MLYNDPREVFLLVTNYDGMDKRIHTTRANASLQLSRMYIAGEFGLDLYDDVEEMIWQSTGPNDIKVF